MITESEDVAVSSLAVGDGSIRVDPWSGKGGRCRGGIGQCRFGKSRRHDMLDRGAAVEADLEPPQSQRILDGLGMWPASTDGGLLTCAVTVMITESEDVAVSSGSQRKGDGSI